MKTKNSYQFLEKEIEDRKNKLTAKSWRGDLSKRGLKSIQWGDLKEIEVKLLINKM